LETVRKVKIFNPFLFQGNFSLRCFHTTELLLATTEQRCNFRRVHGLSTQELFWIWSSGARRKFSWEDFIQWHMVVICMWCALFVTSQYDVIFMFPNQCFGEVCW